MKAYTVKNNISSDKTIVLDDMILTKELPTVAGSKMLEGYVSLFEAEALTRATEAGYVLGGKVDVGEFSIDLLGETSKNGALTADGKLQNAAAEIVKSEDAVAALCLDANGSVRRAAAQNGLISLKPTYGTVSRFGIIPAVCSGETVSILAKKLQIAAIFWMQSRVMTIKTAPATPMPFARHSRRMPFMLLAPHCRDFLYGKGY